MPSGVAPMVILEPANAALAAAKIFGQSNPAVLAQVQDFQENHRQRLFTADEALNN
jgi:phosphoribosylcarboxyaminoimidazole (NCAIR) mutase